MSDKPKQGIYRKGIMTALGLFVLTIIEYFAGIAENPSTIILLLLAVAKAGIVLNIFMGITRLWSNEEHH